MRATTMVGFVFSFVFLGLLTQLAVANNRIITLQEDMERVKEESSYILESNRKVNKQDRTADGHALTEARKQLKEETQLRLDVEKELEMQIGMRQEMELAMKMLEKDVCEKQDALVVLRQQLDDLRALKLELSFKLQSSDLGMKQKSELNSRLEEKTSQMAATIKLLEQSFCFLSQVHMAHTQIAAVQAGVPVSTGGQSALQGGIWGQDQQPSSRSGATYEAARPA
uniref:Uncharacterized protein n=1 Tax=Micrurus spixii TaxID=129469 RepID=A0A2D4M8D7_9SAUR